MNSESWVSYYRDATGGLSYIGHFRADRMNPTAVIHLPLDEADALCANLFNMGADVRIK